MENHIFTVSELNNLVKSLLDSIPELNNIYLRGEISNYKLYPSGHHYFTLKDAEGALRCVMFKGQALRLRFRPENGMKVIAMGRVSVYPDGKNMVFHFVTFFVPPLRGGGGSLLILPLPPHRRRGLLFARAKRSKRSLKELRRLPPGRGLPALLRGP